MPQATTTTLASPRQHLTLNPCLPCIEIAEAIMNVPAILSSSGTRIKQQRGFALTVTDSLGTVLRHSERLS
ncbi:MAG: hypothetical protein QF922_04175 [SAR324 cluster bacterium]|nr:hypothetical protein [SAR324 cluster bacterium]